MSKLYGINKLYKEVHELPLYPYSHGCVACFANLETREVWGYWCESTNRKWLFEKDSRNCFLGFVDYKLYYTDFRKWIIKRFGEASESYYALERMKDNEKNI